MSDVLSFNNEVFSQFAFYSGVVLCKTLIMGQCTAFSRVTNGIFSNKEDVKLAMGKEAGKVAFNDERVERIRRCHTNDIENVVPFVLIGIFYVSTEPYPEIARRLFQIFTVSRILHTISYRVPLPQPIRALSYFVGWGVTGVMAFRVFTQTRC